MLRQVNIFRGTEKIFEKIYGTSLDVSSLVSFLKQIKKDVIDSINIVDYKIGFAVNSEYDLIFIFINDAVDDDENIYNELLDLTEQFVERFSANIIRTASPGSFQDFAANADDAFERVRNKITVIGFSGVGKTTLMRLLEKKEIPKRHIPTITGEEVSIPISPRTNLYFWDSAGQEKYAPLWKRFVQGADLVLVVVDSSSDKNINDSKLFTSLIRKEEPLARIAIIANKQDLPEAVKPEMVQSILGFPTFPMVAVDPDNRVKMIHVIARNLELLNYSTDL